MKKLLLALIILSVGLSTYAQKASPEVRAQEKVAKLGEQLNLSDEQEEQIVALFVEQFQNKKVDGRKMGQMTKEERDAFIQAKKDQRAAFDQELEGILTPEQLATYQANKNDGKAKGKGKNGKGSSTQRKADKLTESLGLNEQQRAAVITALEEQRSAYGKQSLEGKTKEEKKAAMEARKANKTALDEKFKAIFTPEQYATYQQLNEERKQQKEDKRASNNADKIQNKVNHFTEALSLTPEQTAQVSDLLNTQQAAKTDKSADRAANKEHRAAAKAEFDAKMKEILSAEQYAAFQELQGDLRGKGRKRGGKPKR